MNNKLKLGMGLMATSGILFLANPSKINAIGNLIATSNVNIRSSYSTSSDKIGMVKKGDSVEYISAKNGWYKVRYNGKTGYVNSNYLQYNNISNKNDYTSVSVNLKKITKVNLNVRNTPNVNSKKIITLKANTIVTCTESSNGWYKVKTNVGYGWVNGQYLSDIMTNSNNTTVTNKKYTTPTNLVVVNKSNFTLTIYKNGRAIYQTYCGVGKLNSPTPNCKTTITNKIINRPYYKGNIQGGAVDNPLGYRWLQLGCGASYGIHGVSHVGNPVTKGYASEGCIRINNSQINKVFDLIPVGTTVVISNNPSNKMACQNYNISIK